MLILGRDALARADGAAFRHLAQRIAPARAMIGPAGSPAEGGWNGFNVLHTAAGRVGGLEPCFLSRAGGRAGPWALSLAAKRGIFVRSPSCGARNDTTRARRVRCEVT